MLAEGTWKRSIIQHLGQPSTLIRYDDRNFSKTLHKLEKLESSGFRITVGKNILKTGFSIPPA